MTLQEFINDLFRSILTVDSSLPAAVKYLFDFFESAAERHGVNDPNVVHTWKTNRYKHLQYVATVTVVSSRVAVAAHLLMQQ